MKITPIFPHPTLTPIIGKPTPQALFRLKEELIENAACVATMRGGGGFGYAATILSDMEYLTLPGAQAFLVPAHPGATAVHAPGADAEQMAATIRLFEHNKTEYETYMTIIAHLKQQILAAVDPLYYQVLKVAGYGYTRTTAKAILAHLMEKYGKITRESTEANRAALADEWNPDDPLETIWARIAEAKEYAALAGAPISDEEVITLTLQAFQKSGVFEQDIDWWERLDEDEQTWPEFVKHFEMGNKQRERRVTTKHAGYHGANNAQANTPAKSTTPKAPPSPQRNIRSNNDIMMYYCWTHGLGLNSGHTGATCQRKAEGHQDHATIDNRMGGSTNLMIGGDKKRRAKKE
jgi:hypothetical protein